MFRRVFIVASLLLLVCSITFAYPNTAKYNEQIINNPNIGYPVLKKGTTCAILVPNKFPLMTEVSFFYKDNILILGNISILQLNSDIPIDIKKVILLSDFRSVSISSKDHRRDTGLEYTTDHFMISPLLEGDLKALFKFPSTKIVLRLIDSADTQHDYFLDMDYIELIKKTLSL